MRCPQRRGSWLGDTKSAEDSGRYSPEFSRASLLALFPFLPSSPHQWMKIGCMIRAAHQRTGCDVEKTFSARDVAVITELLRRYVFNDRQMFRSRAQILAHGQALTPTFPQFIHLLKSLVLF